MLKNVLVLCAALLAVLTGCTPDAPAAGQAVREHFAALAHAEMHVKILSNLGDSTLEYQVDYEYNKEDTDLLTVTAPDGIAGVSLAITGETPDAFVLQYAGAALDVQMADIPGMTPADAIPALFCDLAQSEPTETAAETLDGVPAVSLQYETMDVTPALTRTVWLRADTLAPVCAELYVDGGKQLTLFFQQYQE